ncbi:MAG: YadA C-terminal domain-containing protein, partial [Alphaproteobacteria bacterium]|nr:YadA C-terminal domain-containing protein [Alphaproteobacteria bacterium]
LVQAVSPGRSIVSGGIGYWNGQTTMAFGLSHRFTGELNGWTVRASGVLSTQGNGVGGGFGVGYEF